jgi:phosphohistidine phosphatase SixA
MSSTDAMGVSAWRALLAAALLWPCAAHADEATWALLKKGGQVVLVRHALTDPGVGDPPGFALDDCKTQRNLSERGREEAQRLGAAIRARGIPVAKVLSSPWCRCIETAKIAFGGSETNAALGNLFEHPQNRERQLIAFRALVAKAPPKGNLILVTHGSTTLAFTGVSPATAEMVVVTPTGNGQVRVAGRIPVADAPDPTTPPGSTK